MCLYPRLIKNRKYTANKKNGGNIPPVPDERVKYVPIGCQRCIECRKQKARAWQVRLLEDIKENRNGKFITLTFSNEGIKKVYDQLEDKELTGYELDNEIATRAMRLFLERWRKKYGKSLRHWMVTELGHNGTENIHLHGIVWTDEISTIEDIWQYGFVWKGKLVNDRLINYVNERTVNYIIKYVSKQDFDHKEYQSKILTSKGIGRNYMKNPDHKRNKYQGKDTIEYYRTRTGHKIAMPTYWRNKIYSEKERELLWLNMLDKQIRYVRGEKVDVSKGFKEYDELVKYHRINNIKLGYGTDEKNEERIEYERRRRIINFKKRMGCT